MQPAPLEDRTYLCSYGNHFFTAPVESVDRTKLVRCPKCTKNSPRPLADGEVEEHLRGITT